MSVFDFQSKHELQITLHGNEMRGRIFGAANPLDLLEAATQYLGRMTPLPQWLHRGAVIGMQGGRTLVEERLKRLNHHRAAVSAFWLQDWVCLEKRAPDTSCGGIGEVDEVRYPDWRGFIEELAAISVRVKTYINPFLVDVKKKPHRENHFAQAQEKGRLVKRADGSDYAILNTSFAAGPLDLTNEECRTWVKSILKKQMLEVGVSGWMADFGEALPFDAVLADGTPAADYHNRYPEEWARLNREAIEESGKQGEAVFFTRSGFTQAPRFSTLFWLGDQLTTWTAEDGIKSAVTGLLSSGFSGFTLNHSDIGGYAATTVPHVPLSVPGISFSRSRELLWRWIELNAFTAVFRTHEGNQPNRNFQIFDDEATLAHFARFSRVYAALAEYRERLCQEAAEKGWPLVRHPWLHDPDNAQLLKEEHQFLLGADLLAAPVLNPAQTVQSVLLPQGNWVHLWSNRKYEAAESGLRFAGGGPLGGAPRFLAGRKFGVAAIFGCAQRGRRPLKPRFGPASPKDALIFKCLKRMANLIPDLSVLLEPVAFFL